MNHDTPGPFTSIALNIEAKIEWSAVSKAFHRSINTTPLYRPASMLHLILSDRYVSAVSVETDAWKPNWIS